MRKWKKLSAPIVQKFYKKWSNDYNLGNSSEVLRLKVHIGFHGQQNIPYPDLKIWAIIPVEMKNFATVSAFKREIKNRKPVSCPCIVWPMVLEKVFIKSKYTFSDAALNNWIQR